MEVMLIVAKVNVWKIVIPVHSEKGREVIFGQAGHMTVDIDDIVACRPFTHLFMSYKLISVRIIRIS